MITKLDLMDEGTDAKDILENKLLPLRRGENSQTNIVLFSTSGQCRDALFPSCGRKTGVLKAGQEAGG